MQFRIKTLARARGWTMEDLAVRSGVKYSTVKNLWQGRTKDPAYSTLRALAHALGVLVEQLEAPDADVVIAKRAQVVGEILQDGPSRHG